MMGIIPNSNEEIDYAELFDPGEGNQAIGDYGTQHLGSLYTPDTAKWQAKDCPLCFEPFAVKKMRLKSRGYHIVWYCTNCHRRVSP